MLKIGRFLGSLLPKLTFAVPCLVAGAMLAFVAIPGNVWKPAQVDLSLNGFDPNLVYRVGGVVVTSAETDLISIGSQTSITNFVTTTRERFTARLDAEILENARTVEPLRIGVWSPWSRDGSFIVFGPSPKNQISLERMINGTAGPTLEGGFTHDTPLATYSLGQKYHLSIDVNRSAGTILATVSGGGIDVSSRLERSDAPALFRDDQMSLVASSTPGAGAGAVSLTNFVLSVPHQRSFAVRVQDPFASGILAGLALLGAAAMIRFATHAYRNGSLYFSGPTAWPGFLAQWAIVPCVICVVGNALLLPLAGHPFDFANEEFYAYVARNYGPAQLYFLPDVVSFPKIWGGVPWVQASFPYEPVIAYLFTGAGWITSVVFAGGGPISLATPLIGYVIKSINIAFALGDGALIYLILKNVDVSERWRRAGAALFILNPAVWFSASVWGQTHVMSIFFVLAAMLFAQQRRPTLAWLALAAGCLTRPQMLVFGLLLGAVFFRKFPWRENVVSLSVTVITAFIALVPFMLATSPSLPIDIFLNVAHVEQGGGNQASLTTVSQDAYSIWPLVTYFARGASSLDRLFLPSQEALVGSLTYQTAGQLLTGALLAFLVGVLLLKKRADLDAGGYIPAVAIGIAGFLMLLTGIVSTHFLLALPLLVLCRRWMDPIAYLYVVTTWTASTLIPMFADMSIALSGQNQSFAPDHNPVVHFIVVLYASDRFITVATVGNVCALIWLGILALRGSGKRSLDPV